MKEAAVGFEREVRFGREQAAGLDVELAIGRAHVHQGGRHGAALGMSAEGRSDNHDVFLELQQSGDLATGENEHT